MVEGVFYERVEDVCMKSLFFLVKIFERYGGNSFGLVWRGFLGDGGRFTFYERMF